MNRASAPAKDARVDIDLDLERGSFQLHVGLVLPARGITVVFGPSGSGKTTLLRCLAGLEAARGRITLGTEVWLDSTAGHHVPTWKRDIGYVFQEASLFEHLNVRGNLQYGLKRVGKSEAHAALERAIELLGIRHLLDRDVSTLSGGERQRVAITRALATVPRLLLLDEPLASLDQTRRNDFLPWLDRLHRELEMPVVYVTHSMHELVRLADHVVLLREGRVVISGAAATVLADPVFLRDLGQHAGAIMRGIVAERDPDQGLVRVELQDQAIWVRDDGLEIGSSIPLHVQLGFDARQPNRDPSTPPAKA